MPSDAGPYREVFSSVLGVFGGARRHDAEGAQDTTIDPTITDTRKGRK
jgi:hypothetical protein